jgi:hypothetical protein
MRRLKQVGILAFSALMLAYVSAYYHSWNFEDYVRHETERSPVKQILKRSLLDQAPAYGVVLEDGNIDISTHDSVLRVEVGYRVPVNFLLFQHQLAFRTVAGASVWVH